MISWVKNNIIQMLIILVTVTFGYANFTSRIESTAMAQTELKSKFEEYQRETNDKLDKLIRITERIDERTQSGR